MANGSRIVVAEAFLHPHGVNYRVATGAGWAAVGGSGQRWGRWFATDAFDDQVDALVTESNRALLHIANYVRTLADFLDAQRVLPLVAMPDLVRSAPER